MLAAGMYILLPSETRLILFREALKKNYQIEPTQHVESSVLSSKAFDRLFTQKSFNIWIWPPLLRSCLTSKLNNLRLFGSFLQQKSFRFLATGNLSEEERWSTRCVWRDKQAPSPVKSGKCIWVFNIFLQKSTKHRQIGSFESFYSLPQSRWRIKWSFQEIQRWLLTMG